MRIANYAKILAIAILVILLFVFPPLTGPVWLTFFSFAFVIAIACLGINLVAGHTGLLSLGHAAYFGIGGYSVALLMFWYNIRGMEILLLTAVGIAALVALAGGYVASRLSKMYFAIFTLAITQVVWSLLVRDFDITGGASGIYVKNL
ncbi:MAG: hypothetical protein NXY59_06855 [Aigarchaeota archaeon]|nr:hypothetical protein [Candidatus Pelearchaeum maunauluense]